MILKEHGALRIYVNLIKPSISYALCMIFASVYQFSSLLTLFSCLFSISVLNKVLEGALL